MSGALFSSAWYRVADLKIRLRRHTRIHRHTYRDRTWYVLQDRMTGQFHRFTPEAYEVIGRMDGRRSLQQIWDDACARLGSFQLEGCTVYTSCEPCPMCLGALYWARPARIVYAATRQDASDAGFDDSLIYEELPLAPADRRYPMEHFLRSEAQQVFAAWKAMEGRTRY